MSLACKVEGEPCESNMMCANLSDEEMVERAKCNKECFACLVERYDSKLKRYIRRITGASSETVDDIVQEVFIKVYTNIHKFDQDKKFSSWIYRIAHNVAVSRYLYEKRRMTESITWEENGELKSSIKDVHDTWGEIQQEDVNEMLHTALKAISEKYRQVITCNYFQDMSYLEISSELEKPINTVGTMLSRGRKLLKKELMKMGVSCDVALVQMEKNFS